MTEIPNWESEQGLPDNLQYVRHLGSRGYYESFVWDGSHLRIMDSEFADIGEQLDEGIYENALEHISGLAERFNDKTRFLHVRQDHEEWFDESPDNATFKLVEGHGNVKIMASWLVDNGFHNDNGIWKLNI